MEYKINKVRDKTFKDYNTALLYLHTLRDKVFEEFFGLVNEYYPNEKTEDKERLTNKLIKSWFEDVKILPITN